MGHLLTILRFGFSYLRQYSGRFIAGVLLAVFFGLCNGLLLWAINTVLHRISDPPAQVQSSIFQHSGGLTGLKEWATGGTEGLVDAWLPRGGIKPTARQVLGGLLLFPLLATLRGFGGYLSSYCLAWVSERVVNDLRVDVLQNLSRLSLDFYNRSTMGDLLTRVNVDTAALQRCLSLGLSDLIKEPVTIIGVVAGLFLIDWQLTVLMLIFLPIVVLPIIYFGRLVRRSSTAGLKTSITQSSLLVEMLSGIRVIKAFNLEQEQVARFRKHSRDLVNYAMRGMRAKEMINPIIETVSTFAFGLILVYIVYRQIPIQNMVSLLAGVAFIYTPIKKLAGIHILLQQTRAGLDRLMHILHEQPTVEEPAVPVLVSKLAREITFESASFSYGHKTVLQGIDLSIAQGVKLGVAGESGSGKSTLVNLLFRFYDPTEGAIRIDGQDIRAFNVAALRNLMALVSQEIVLFDLTVAENIACGKRGATRQQIEAAARSAFAHDFILGLPHGYETRIGERGVTLSGGQRQRIAIARAFIRDAPILVLDEATAALDAKSEAEVQAAIERLEENRTVICVAHRLATLRSMDWIIVLSEGRIVEQGSFAQLLAEAGDFAAMARRQGINAQGPAAGKHSEALA